MEYTGHWLQIFDMGLYGKLVFDAIILEILINVSRVSPQAVCAAHGLIQIAGEIIKVFASRTKSWVITFSTRRGRCIQ